MSKIEIPFESELQEQEIIFPEGFEARIEDGKIILRKKLCEDENIRLGLIAYFKNNSVISSWAGLNVNKVLAWLEKQAEQKQLSQSQEPKTSDKGWSEECDENLMMIEDRFGDYLDYIREDSSLTKHRKNTLKEEIIGYVNWLKTLKERLS